MSLESPFPCHWLDERNKLHPNRPFIYYQDNNRIEQSITYSTFFEKVQLLAVQLANNPAKTIIGVCSKHPLDYLICMMAAFQLQMIYLPFGSNFNNPTPETIEKHLELARNYFRVPGLIYTSNNMYLPQILRPYQFLMDDLKLTEKGKIISEYNIQNPAYICCSSGTKSKPKLILNTFEGLHLRAKEHAGQVFDETEGQTLLGFSGFDFDASVLDFLMTLYKGQSLYIVPDYVKQNIYCELPRLFNLAMKNKHPITASVLLPGILRGVNGKGLDPIDFPGLRTIVTMGDTCQIQWLNPWLKKRVKVYNGYGHTETSIASLVAPITSKNTYLPLGQPLDGAIIYLVELIENSDDFHVVATIRKETTKEELVEYSRALEGKTYELYQGGIGVGTYIHQQEEHRAFLDQSNYSLWQFPGSDRVYRSGDLVSLTDGDLVFKGRINLSKRNGLRVILNHIEEKFKQISNIEHVLVKELDEFIVVYIKFSTDLDENSRKETIKNLYQLRNELEPHLKPDFFLELEQIDYTDRYKLTVNSEQLKKSKFLSNTELLPCETPMEIKLAKLFATLLLPEAMHNIELIIQRNANFVELGGDSIKLSKLTSLIWENILGKDSKLGIPFEFSNFIYVTPRLADIAAYLETYEYNPTQKFKKLDGYLPIFYVSNLTPPLHFLQDQPLKTEIIRLVPKQFSEKELSTAVIIIRGWESMLEQCMRAIYEHQHIGPYILLTNQSDESFTQRIAIQLAQTGTIIHLICYDTNTETDIQILQSLNTWAEKKSLAVSGIISRSNPKNPEHLVEQLNECYENACQEQLIYKIKKYHSKIQQNPVISNITNSNREARTAIENYFHSDNTQPVILSGPANSGKKTLCFELYEQLTIAYSSDQNNALPLIVDVSKRSELSILTILKSHGFNTKDFEILQTKQTILFILNYDAINRYDFPNYRLQLANWQNLKIIICTRDFVTPNLLSANWAETPYQRIELKPQVTEILLTEEKMQSPDRQGIIDELFLVRWLQIEFQRHPIDVGSDFSNYLENLFDYINKFPEDSIRLEPRPSIWEPGCTRDDQLISGLIYNPYFVTIRGLLQKDPTDNNLFYFPPWLRSLAKRNNAEKANTASAFTSFEITWHKHTSPLIQLLSPEELQAVIVSDPSFVQLNTGRQQAPLFLFHPLTGSTPVEYRNFSKLLGPTQPIYNFVMSENNHSSSVDFYDRCQYFVSLIKKIQPTGKVHLAGWSFGGLLAFGVACVLEQSREIGLILNIDCSSPGVILDIPPGERAIDLISTLPKLFSLRSDFDIKQECQDLELQRLACDLTIQELTALLDTIFDKAIEFYQQHSSLDTIKKAQFVTALKNSCLNLKAAYCSVSYEFKLKKSHLHIIEARHTIGINPGMDKLAGYSWEPYVGDPHLLTTHQFHKADHFTICKDQDFLKLFCTLVNTQQVLVQPITIKHRIKAYIKRYTPDPLYIPAHAQDSEFDSKRYNLAETKLRKFLQNPAKFLLFYGAPGSGKTTFFLNVMAEQARHKKSYSKLCIYVKLNDSLLDSIIYTLHNNGFTEIEIYNDIKNRPILFLLDGFENVKTQQQWHLLQSEWPNAKFIISCRTEKAKNSNLVSLLSEYPLIVSELHLSQFNKLEIDDYIKKYEKHFITKFDIQNKLSELTVSKSLTGNPLVLRMLLDIMRQTGSLALANLNRFNIYETHQTLNYQRVLQQLSENHGIPPGINIEAAANHYAECISVELYTDVHEEFHNYSHYFSHDFDTKIIREATAITEHLGKPQFVHETYAEYYFSRRLIQNLVEEKYELWCKVSFTQKSSLLEFLAEKLNNSPKERRLDLIEKLFSLVLASRIPVDQRSIVGASNAITVLNYARVPFSGRDLSYIQIYSADLSNSVNDHTSYFKATFENIDFYNAWLKNANLREASLKDVRFGILPYILESDQIRNFVLSPRGTYLAILFERAPNVRLYDLKTYHTAFYFYGKNSPFVCVSFSPDEKFLIAADDAGTEHFWQIGSPNSTRLNNSATNLLFSPDGQQYCIAVNRAFFVVDTNTRRVIKQFDTSANFFWYMPAAEFILVGTQAGQLKIINLNKDNSEQNNLIGIYSSDIVTSVNNGDHTFVASTWSPYTISLKHIVPNRLRNTIGKVYSKHLLSGVRESLHRLETFSTESMAATTLERTQKLTSSLTEVLSDRPYSETRTEHYSIREYTLAGNNSKITHLVFHPTADILFSAYENNEIIIWNVAKKSMITKLVINSPISAIATHSRDSLLAVACKNGRIQIWGSTNWVMLNSLYAHSCNIIKIEFSDNLLISVDKDSRVRFLSIEGLRSTYSIGHNLPIDIIKYNKMDDEIISLTSDGKLCQWDIFSGQLLSMYQLPHSKLYTINNFGNYIAGVADGKIFLWESGLKETISVPCILDYPIQLLQLHPSEKILYIALKNGKVIQVNLNNLESNEIVLENVIPIKELVFCLNDMLMIAICDKGKLYVYNLFTNKLLACPELAEINAISTYSHSSMIAISCGHTAFIYTVPSFNCIFQIEYETSISKISLSPDGVLLAILTTNQSIDIWDHRINRSLEHYHNLKIQNFCWNDASNILGLVLENSFLSWQKHDASLIFYNQRPYIIFQNCIFIKDYFITIGKEGEIIAWQFVVDPQGLECQMIWRTHSTPLKVSGMQICETQEIKSSTREILRECAVDENIPYGSLHLQAARINNVSVDISDLDKRLVNIQAGPLNETALHLAVYSNNVAFAEKLIILGADLNQVNSFGWTPLHIAAHLGYEQMITMLLDHHCDKNPKTQEQKTPITLAIDAGKLSTLVLLLKRCKNIVSILNSKPYPLVSAIYSDNVDIATFLLNSGADPNVIDDLSAIHIAAINGSPKMIKLLLNFNAEIDKRFDANDCEDLSFREVMINSEKNFCTALHLASKHKHKEVVVTLLRAGASIISRTQQGWTALHFAAQAGDIPITEILLQNGACSIINEKTAQDKSALSIAIETGHDALVQLLLKYGADPNITENNIPVLVKVVLKNSKELTLALINHKAELNFQLQNDITVLRAAVETEDEELVKVLLNNHADPNLSLQSDFSPIRYTTIHGNLPLVQLLVHAGTNIHGIFGSTLLALAVINQHPALVEFFLFNGADPNLRVIEGHKPIWYAVQRSSVACVKLLAPVTIDIDEYDENCTLFHMAAILQQLDILNILLQHGANPMLPVKNEKTSILFSLIELKAEETVIFILEHFPEMIDVQAECPDGTTSTLLYNAIYHNSKKVVKYLIFKGVNLEKNLETRNEFQKSPLELAIFFNHWKIIRILIQGNVNIEARNFIESTPLHQAILQGQCEAVEELLKGGANIESEFVLNIPPIHLAITQGNERIFDLLLQYGADSHPRTKNYNTLSLAISLGKLYFIKKLLALGADYQCTDDDGNNLLFAACNSPNRKDLVEIIAILLSLGLSYDHKNAKGNTFMHYVVANNVKKILTLLKEAIFNNDIMNNHGTRVVDLLQLVFSLQERAKVIFSDENLSLFKPIHLAAALGDIEATSILLNASAKIIGTKKNNLYPLHLVVRHDQFSLLIYYLELKSHDIDCQDSQGKTPLHHAAYLGRMDIVKILIEHGASLSIRSKDCSIMHYAVGSNNLELVRYLHQLGVSVSDTDTQGHIPLQWATEKDAEGLEMVELLIELGSELDTLNIVGETILHNCISLGYLSPIPLLLIHGANPLITSLLRNKTALDLALEENLYDIVNLILEATNSLKPVLSLANYPAFFASINQDSSKSPVANLNKGYRRKSVSDDGNCGYTAFGFTREQAHELIINRLIDVRDLLNLPVQEVLLTNNFLAYLKQHDAVGEGITLEHIQNNIERYARNLNILRAYINYDVRDTKIDAGWAHPAVLQALASIQEIELHIWQLGNNDVLVPHQNNVYADNGLRNVQNRVDLLFINGNHFERLEIQGGFDGEIYPLEIQMSTNQTTPSFSK